VSEFLIDVTEELAVNCSNALAITVPNYRRWIRDIEELQTVKMNYALLADPDCAVLASVRACSSTVQ
jgi:hypothetical protein